MSQSFIKKPDNGPHSSAIVLGDALATRPPCTVCGTPAERHGTYPTCASHPYTPDGNCQHVLGAACVGAECRHGCVRARGNAGVTACPEGCEVGLIGDTPDTQQVCPVCDGTGAPGATDAERAAWLADKIVALGDYAKEAAAMLRRWPDGVDSVDGRKG